MGKAIRSVTKAISKIIPNEIKPILPYAALFIPGLQGAGGLLAKYGVSNPIFQKMLISGATRGLTDSEAGFKDILKTGVLAAAPNIIQSGLGSLGDYLNPITTEGIKGSIEAAKIGSNIVPAAQQTLTQQIGQLATQAANSGIVNSLANPQGLLESAKAITYPSTVEYGAKAVEAAQKAKEEYERQNADFQNFAGQQLADFNLGRRNSILGSLTRAGFAEDEINSTLAQLGLRNGGRVGAMDGGIMDVRRGLVEIPGGYSGNRYKQLLQLLEEARAMGDMDKIKEVESDLFREYNKKKDGGLMGLKMGGRPMEMDYRMGGFIPVGSKERADDVPARLSKNEFVMTADAVRAAGGGSVNEGAQKMYQLMNQLEGRLS
jgi:hypothetical protein